MILSNKKLIPRDFIKDVIKLSSGTVAARILYFAALPFLTRIYSPDDFALLAAFMALTVTMATVVSVRLEIAIPLAKSESEAIEILLFALFFISLMSLFFLILNLYFSNIFADIISIPKIEPYLFLVPVAAALVGSYSVFQYWETRNRNFGKIARNRIIQGVSGVFMMLVLGFIGLVPLGLILGNIASRSIGFIGFASCFFKEKIEDIKKVRINEIVKTLFKNRMYPLYSTPEALINVAGAQVPILLIASSSGSEAGYLWLSMQLVMIPMSLVGSSISQVYLSRAPSALHEERLAVLTLSIIRRLLIYSVGILALVFMIAPILFPFIFGIEWVRAGEIVTLLIPVAFMQLLVSPVSMALYVTNHQRMMLVLTLLGFFLRVGGVIISERFFLGTGVIGFVLGSLAYYLVLFFSILLAVRINKYEMIKLIKTFFDFRVSLPLIITVSFFLTMRVFE